MEVREVEHFLGGITLVAEITNFGTYRSLDGATAFASFPFEITVKSKTFTLESVSEPNENGLVQAEYC